VGTRTAAREFDPAEMHRDTKSIPTISPCRRLVGFGAVVAALLVCDIVHELIVFKPAAFRGVRFLFCRFAAMDNSDDLLIRTMI
jgi:hypothetical protein